MTCIGLELDLFRPGLDMGGVVGIIRRNMSSDRSFDMPSHIDHTVSDLRSLLKKQEDQIGGTKRTINSLLVMAGKEPMFSEADLAEEGSDLGLAAIASDRWYGQPLATAIRDYLSLRRASGNGPATVAEMFNALREGGFEFEAKNDDYAKRGLRSSLTKNPSTFHRLPDGKRFGLTEWYPRAANKGGEASDDSAEKVATDVGEADEDNGGAS